ncbi:MAG: hypothetical protein M1831_000539 [Alyxoria varia]|nr:MAG: hypothetical protein M1831_000539 [Alyxoria varia]
MESNQETPDQTRVHPNFGGFHIIGTPGLKNFCGAAAVFISAVEQRRGRKFPASFEDTVREIREVKSPLWKIVAEDGSIHFWGRPARNFTQEQLGLYVLGKGYNLDLYTGEGSDLRQLKASPALGYYVDGLNGLAVRHSGMHWEGIGDSRSTKQRYTEADLMDIHNPPSFLSEEMDPDDFKDWDDWKQAPRYPVDNKDDPIPVDNKDDPIPVEATNGDTGWGDASGEALGEDTENSRFLATNPDGSVPFIYGMQNEYPAKLLLNDEDTEDEPLLFGNLDELVDPEKEGVSVSLRFNHLRQHDSTVEIQLSIRYQDATVGRIVSESMASMHHHKNVKLIDGSTQAALEVNSVADMPEDQQARILDSFGLSLDSSTSNLWQVIISSSRKLYARKLFTNRDDLQGMQPTVQRLKDALRHSHDRDGIELVCRGDEVNESVAKLTQDWSMQQRLSYLQQTFVGTRVDLPLFDEPNTLRSLGPDLEMDRQPVVVPAKPTYFEAREAFMLWGISHRNEVDHLVDIQNQTSQDVELRAFDIPGATSGGITTEYAAYITFKDKVSFSPKEGDTLILDLEPNKPKDRTHDYRVVLVAPDEVASIPDSKCYLKRRWSKEDTAWVAFPSSFHSHVINDLKDLTAGRIAVRDARPVNVSAKLVPSLESHHRVKKGLQHLQKAITRELEDAICANDLESAPRIDCYEDTDNDGRVVDEEKNVREGKNKATFEKIQNSKDRYLDILCKDFDEAQRPFLWKCRQMTAQILLIKGPAGSGKNHVMNRAMQGLFLRPDKQGQKKQVIVATATNEGADSIASHFYRSTQKLQGPYGRGEPIVVRLHTPETEETIFFSRPESNRPVAHNARPPTFEDGEDAGLAASAIKDFVAAYIRERHAEDESQRFQGVFDKRVKYIDLSAGWWMMRRIGYFNRTNEGEPRDRFYKEKPYSHSLREELKAYVRGAEFDKTRYSQLKALAKQCLEDVLGVADVITGTVSQFLVAKVFSKCLPYWLFIDEGGRLTIEEFWSLRGYYDSVHAIFVAGDTEQQEPQYENRGNHLKGYQAKSALELLDQAGFDRIVLNQQNRCVTDIGGLVSNTFYNGRIASRGDLDNHPMAERFRQWSRSFFQTEDLGNVVLVDVPDSKCVKLPGSTSSLNEESMGVYHQISSSMEQYGLVNRLHTNPFAAQRILGNRVTRECKFKDTKSFTWAGAQGMQTQTGVCEFVVGDRFPFIQSKNLLVGLTRFRYGLVIIANLKMIQGNTKGCHGTKLAEVINYCTSRDWVVEWQSKKVDDSIIKVMPIKNKDTGDRNSKGVILAQSGPPVCYNCGEEGHERANCTQPKKFQGSCNICKEKGHRASQCSLCRICLQPDHRAINCPIGKQRNKLCDNCGEEGHRKNDCTRMPEDHYKRMMEDRKVIVGDTTTDIEETRPVSPIEPIDDKETWTFKKRGKEVRPEELGPGPAPGTIIDATDVTPFIVPSKSKKDDEPKSYLYDEGRAEPISGSDISQVSDETDKEGGDETAKEGGDETAKKVDGKNDADEIAW